MPPTTPFPPVDQHLAVESNTIQTPSHRKFLHLLPKDRVNLLVPAGVGDLYWTLCKFRDSGAVFWIPESEQHRAGGLAQMAGVEYGYLTGLTTPYLWSRPGTPKIEGPGVYELHPNRHLEDGKRLEAWYPVLPLEYPKLAHRHQLLGQSDHVFVFMCGDNYMAGQLSPEIWASTLSILEDRHGQIVLCGAAGDVEHARKVNQLMGGSCLTLFDRPLNEVLAWITASRLCVGVASGLTILAICHQIPTLIAYPRHLGKMPGSWEPLESRWRYCYLDSLQECVMKHWDMDIVM